MIFGYSILQILFGNNSNSEENTPNTDQIIHATITKKIISIYLLLIIRMVLYGGGASSKKRFDDIFIIDLAKE